MKITTTDKPEVQKYPYLGICDDLGLIVLFTSPLTGVAVWRKNESRGTITIGQYSIYWYETLFTPYNGSVTLEN